MLSSLLALFVATQSASVPKSWLDAELPKLESLYRELHTAPEISYQEAKTAARMAAELKAVGCEVTERVGRYAVTGQGAFGVVGVLRNGEGPTILIRTDLDGLPVEEKTGLPYASKAMAKDDAGRDVAAMHACGHDMHMTCFVGTARALAAQKERWKGTLLFVAQPAEERAPGGAEAMLRDGLYERFPKPAFGVALHCSPSIAAGNVGWVSGFALAGVDTVEITVRGVGGHGAYPHATKDPVVLASQIVLALQTIVSRETAPGEPAVVTVGSIHGGTKHNIIPDEVKLELTVRSYASATRARVLQSIERIAMGTAKAAGVPEDRLPLVSLNPERFVPATFNHPDATSRCRAAMERELGAAHVEAASPVMGGEDFGHYSLPDHSIPCFMFWLGTQDPQKLAEWKAAGKEPPSLHSSLFAPVPAPTIRTGVEAMTACVLELAGK